MKKLNLKDLTFQRGEVLTRSQLKNVLGGGGSSASGSGSGSGYPVCKDTCTTDSDCTGTSAGLVCKSHAVFECSNKPKGCYLP
ncbi:hypothetical protein [Pedobacter sp. B4-66]|uniref:hypothetical protein n=1 Tax=Pedobacter sp. B4-66 TaxID=2817280 RepID=UPI001BD99086|nr:hypothetical protein [Pedobacter sp. B4-66]